MSRRLVVLLASIGLLATVFATAASAAIVHHRFSKMPSGHCATFKWHKHTIYSSPVGGGSCKAAVAEGKALAKRNFKAHGTTIDHGQRIGNLYCESADESSAASGHLAGCTPTNGDQHSLSFDFVPAHTKNPSCSRNSILQSVKQQYGYIPATKILRHLCFDGTAIATWVATPNGGGPQQDTEVFIAAGGHWYDQGSEYLNPSYPSDTSNAPIAAAAAYTLLRYFVTHRAAGRD